MNQLFLFYLQIITNLSRMIVRTCPRNSYVVIKFMITRWKRFQKYKPSVSTRTPCPCILISIMCVFGYRNVKSFGVNYTLFFSSTKQIGALLFSLAFLTVSSLVTNERVRKSALISAIGIAILFGSIEITTLQYRLYPPFGLVTQAFMTLGAYLLLVGLITSATSVARDAKLRKEFYKNATSQISLLKTIEITEMEKELLRAINQYWHVWMN